jgi:hypothetical protein
MSLTQRVLRSAGRNILRFSHGYDLHDDPKPTLKTFHTTMTQFEAAMVPGAFLVDVFPFCACNTLMLMTNLRV